MENVEMWGPRLKLIPQLTDPSLSIALWRKMNKCLEKMTESMNIHLESAINEKFRKGKEKVS